MIDNKHQSHGQCQSELFSHARSTAGAISLFLIFLIGNLYNKLATELQDPLSSEASIFIVIAKADK